MVGLLAHQFVDQAGVGHAEPVSPVQLVVAGVAGFLAGLVNALAGGGTLISFPILIALGLPPVSANITNTVALSPGYLGGALAQKAQIRPQRARVIRMGAVAGAGGLLGSILLVFTSDSAFELLIPALLFLATVLLAVQDRLRSALGIVPAPSVSGEHDVDLPAETPASTDRATTTGPPEGAGDRGATSPMAGDGASTVEPHDPTWLAVPIFLVSVYGGYFGAGLGIMMLAILGIVLHEALNRLNALKQTLAFVINATAAVFFLTSGKVYWVVALVMAVTSLAGGATGGRLAGTVKPQVLRAIVVVIGTSVAVVYAIKTWF